MITFNVFDLAIYLLAVGAYAYVGFCFFAFGMLLTMDSGSNVASVLYHLIIVGLWITGLIYGTQAYY